MSHLTRLLLPLAVVVMTVWPAAAATLIGTCDQVSDGDTIVVKLNPSGKREKVRLLGIDTPETAKGPKDPGQEPWGTRAAAFTRNLCLGKQVRIETDVQPRDRYRRLLGYVYVGKTFVNLELVKAGHAMTLTYPPNVRHADTFLAAQREARAAGRGIWDRNEPLPESPRDYRRRKSSKSPKSSPTSPPGKPQPKPSNRPAAANGRVPVSTGAAPATPARELVAVAANQESQTFPSSNGDPWAREGRTPLATGGAGNGAVVPMPTDGMPGSEGVPWQANGEPDGRNVPQSANGQRGAGAAGPSLAHAGPGAAARQDVVLFNTKSRVYHETDCRHANGRNLQEMARSEAQSRGRPCKVCH